MIPITSAIALLALLGEPPPDVTRDDLDRFPKPEEIERNLSFADAHAAWLADHGATHGWGWGLRGWADEARELRRTWELLRLARGDTYRSFDDPEPMDALRELRKRIGPWRFAAGAMPPCVPVWRFTDVGR